MTHWQADFPGDGSFFFFAGVKDGGRGNNLTLIESLQPCFPISEDMLGAGFGGHSLPLHGPGTVVGTRGTVRNKKRKNAATMELAQWGPRTSWGDKRINNKTDKYDGETKTLWGWGRFYMGWSRKASKK